MEDLIYEEYYSQKKGTAYRLMDLRKWVEDNEHYETDTHYVTVCPYCLEAYKHDKSYTHPYTKQKLYITKDYATGYCHRCSTPYFDRNESENIFEVPKFFNEYDSMEPDFRMMDPRYQLSLLDMYPTLNNFDLHKLYMRNPYIVNFIHDLDIRSYEEGKMLIPFRYKGNIIYYQIYQKPLVPKYKNPPIKTKPLYFCGDIKKNAILVEGVFDAIACRTLYPNHTPIAVLGHSVTGAQLSMLRSYMWSEIKIFMDESKLSYKIFNKLKRIMDFTDFDVVESDGEDPEERLNRLIRSK